jgi:hypothetical protein
MKYYPSLADLISLDRLPDFLGGVRAGLQDLLDDIQLKEYQVERHAYFGGGSWYVVLRTTKRIELDVLGTGLVIVFNPSLDASAPPGSSTDIPLSLSVRLPIADYVRGFDLARFAGSSEELFALISKVAHTDELGLTEATILGVLPSRHGDELVAAINAAYSLSPALAPSLTGDSEEDARAIAAAVATHPQLVPDEKDMLDVLLDTYVLAPSPPLPRLEFLEKVFASYFAGPVVESVKQLFFPQIDASAQLSAGLEFPREYLVPLKPDGKVEEDETVKTVLLFGAGEFRYSTAGMIGFSEPLTISFPPQYPAAQIGNTGLTIGFSNAKLDLSRDKNIPEAISDGRPDDFVGVFIEEATIGLPAFWQKDSTSTAEIKGTKLLFGTGGATGKVGLDVRNGSIFKTTLGAKGFTIALDSFDVTFRQNAITGSTIKGSLTIPGFKDAAGADAKIDIDVHLSSGGDFKVTASSAAGVRIAIPGVLHFDITSASVERRGSRFCCEVAGHLEFEDQGGVIGKFLPDKIEIQKLRIWDDGKIELEGGKLTLPRAISLKVGPVNLSVTAIGLGSHEQELDGQLRQYKYFTFDGGVNVNPGGVDVSGSGIAFYYTVDNGPGRQADRFIRIQSIKVDLKIPGNASAESAVLLLNGYLSMRAAQPPSSGSEYAGAIAFTLPKLKMGGTAAMRLNPSVPAFLVDVGLEISTPILVAASGLGIWGFRGVAGVSYVASKGAIQLADADPWWKYYKAKVKDDYREGIQVSKFSQARGFSLGAGVSLASAADAGQAFASKLFFLLSLPEVFLLQGQAQFLKGRILLTDTTDPPFFALIAVTKTSIEAAFGVKYALPAEGDKPGGIATVDAVTELGFFWGNAAAWYFNIGRDSPASYRVQVRLLSIIDAYFYFMMSGAGIRAGAGASYQLSKKFGPLKAELRAYLDTAGRISFRPRQIGASIQLGGNVELSIFGFGFGLSAAASLAAEGTKPFTISGSLEVCVRVLRKNRCARFEFSWIFNQALDLSETRLLKENPKDSAKALNIHTQEPYELWTGGSLPAPGDLANFVIPLDSFVDVEFAKGVKPSATVLGAFGGNTMGSDYVEYVAPQRGKSDRVRHEYTLDAVEVLYHDGSGWKPYDVYGAATPPELVPFVTSDPQTLKQGFWQYQQPNRHNKLRILAQSPLAYASQGSGDLVAEDLGITTESIFCAPEPIAATCTDFDGFRPVVEEPVPLVVGREVFHQQQQFRLTRGVGRVVSQPSAGHTRALRLDAGSVLEVFLVEPAVSVRLQLRAGTDSALVRFYRRQPLPPARPGLAERYRYALVATLPVAAGAAATEVRYDDLSQPVDRVVVEVGECRADAPLVCDTEVTVQARDLERFLDTLVRRGGLLSGAFELSSCDRSDWEGIFFHTALYGAPNDPAFFRYSLESVSLAALHGRITDWQGFSCDLELASLDGVTAVDWPRLAGVHGLRADPEGRVAGNNYTFLVDADLADGRTHVTLRGRSCYPIVLCEYPDGLPVGDLTSEALALGELLALLAAGNRLVQPRLALAAGEVALYDRAFGTRDAGAAAGVPRKVWLTTQVAGSPLPQLEVSLGDGGSGGAVALALPHPHAGFDFDRVSGLGDLRVDRSRVARASNAFLVDARVRNAGGETTVTLRGDAPFAVVTAAPAAARGAAAAAIETASPLPPRRRSDCTLDLYELCVLDYPAAAFNATLPSQSGVDAEVATIVNAFQGSIQPLWRPYTSYAIRITTTDSLFRESNAGTETTFQRQAVFGFSTAGPLGHYHRYRRADGTIVRRADFAALEDAGRGDEFKLLGLLHYLDFPKCYPNADGQLINAKPLFYAAPKLSLFYLETYVARMFCDWAAWGGLEAANAVFEVVVKDPSPSPDVPEAAAVEAVWKLSPLPLLSRDVTILNNMIRHGSPCATVTEIQPTWLNSEFPLAAVDLQPLKLYTAIFNLRFKRQSDADWVSRELLRYCFQTSRYADLAAQVDSCKLEVDPADGSLLRAALFEADKPFLAADLAVARSVLDDSLPQGDALRQTFADPFNRLLEGALQLAALDPPSVTELNVVRDTTSGRILGILLKSPEPWNDPKLPPDALAGSIRLSVDGGDPALYRALHSKDLSQAFFTNADHSMDVPAGATLGFTFDYRQWDGSQYVTVDSATLEVTLP